MPPSLRCRSLFAPVMILVMHAALVRRLSEFDPLRELNLNLIENNMSSTVIIVAIIVAIIALVVYLLTKKSPTSVPTPTPPSPTGGPTPLPNGVHLTLINQSANVSAADVSTYIAAQQAQIDQDFSPHWGGSAIIDEVAGGWPVYLLDVSDVQGALGYHDVDVNNVPYAKVFVQTSSQAGISWQSVASHEVLETLADANANTTDVGADGCSWYQEVGDPVEDQSYVKNGVQLSDFVLPSWFTVGGIAPFDFLNTLSTPFSVTAGGYATEVCNGQTVQVGLSEKASVDRKYSRKK